MDLESFVSETLTQIANGVRKAQSADTGAWIAPDLQFNDKGKPTAIERAGHPAPQTVQFDVAVTASSQESKEGKASIMVAWFGMGANLEKSSESSVISRVRFELPIVWSGMDRPPRHKS